MNTEPQPGPFMFVWERLFHHRRPAADFSFDGKGKKAYFPEENDEPCAEQQLEWPLCPFIFSFVHGSTWSKDPAPETGFGRPLTV
jgi:hypothetical protein